MKIDRPLWVTGTILSPQQFQQQARWEAYTHECVARLGGLHPWGVLTAVFDKAMLALGQLKADHLCVRFADGSLIDTDQADRLPPVLELATVLSAETQQVTVLLALPHMYANGGNCLKPDEQADRPVRYRQEWVPVQDEFSDRSESMAVARYAVSLRFDGMENSLVDALSLPDWYPQAFSHLDVEEYALVCQIWQREPVLRELVAELDKYHLRGSQEKQAVKPTKHTHQAYYCHSCQCDHADYFDTPFHLIDHHLHVRLYAVLVTLWGCWCIENAIRISHCHKKSTWERYRQRLAPVLALTSGRPVTPYPRYLLGFSPGQQGISCPACQSSWLNYVEEMPAGNPMVHCDACQHQFVMYPDIPKGVDPFAEKTPNDQVPEPDWFRHLFAHTTQAQYQHLRHVWQREPVLRALADRLDEQNPTLGAVYECPRCGNRQVTTSHRDEYYCRFCDKTFAASVGSLFYNLQRRYYYRLYATLVLLWVQWRPTPASAIGKLRKIEVFNYYRKRLQPLFDELGDQPVTPYPRYMAGFTLGRQGVHCLRCQSSKVDAVGFIVVCPDNPKIRCQDCGYEFQLQAWRGI